MSNKQTQNQANADTDGTLSLAIEQRPEWSLELGM